MKVIFRWVLLCCLSYAACGQSVEATSEDSTRTVRFEVGQGVECELLVEKQPIQTRGILSAVDSVSFRLDFGGGYFTTVYLDKLTRMRKRSYQRQRGATAASALGAGLGSGGYFLTNAGPSTLVGVAVAALTGLGLAVASSKRPFRPKDPSIYQGWLFVAKP
jgi:hypothetical protein